MFGLEIGLMQMSHTGAAVLRDPTRPTKRLRAISIPAQPLPRLPLLLEPRAPALTETPSQTSTKKNQKQRRAAVATDVQEPIPLTPLRGGLSLRQWQALEQQRAVAASISAPGPSRVGRLQLFFQDASRLHLQLSSFSYQLLFPSGIRMFVLRGCGLLLKRVYYYVALTDRLLPLLLPLVFALLTLLPMQQLAFASGARPFNYAPARSGDYSTRFQQAHLHISYASVSINSKGSCRFWPHYGAK